jgi:DNA segregation ATPase FtsK/SpoIIIE-like protein
MKPKPLKGETKMHNLTAEKHQLIDGRKKLIDKVQERFLSIYNARRRKFDLEEAGYSVVIINKDGIDDEKVQKNQPKIAA